MPPRLRFTYRLIATATLLFVGIAAASFADVCDPPELLHDVLNCGTCGNSCSTGSLNSIWACQSGGCVFLGCEAGYYDPDSDYSCDYACTFRSAQESCNGLDDDCDGLVDEDITPPPVASTCNISLSATAAECTSGVALSCNGGTWECSFPANVCVGGCSPDDEICDLLDNDCDGSLNENVTNYGLACRSDAGLPDPGHGRCATTGVYECSGPSSTACSASQADCATLPGGCTETCDGIDNDCDGFVDESYTNPGTVAAHYVRPAVTRVSVDRWMFTYEASRPDASLTQPGYGNGYHCTGSCGTIPPAPLGVPLDQTLPCSAPDRQPWAGVTPIEVEQACNAIGGFVCETGTYESACQATASCSWAYSPAGPACNSPSTALKYCNLSASYDFDPGATGDQFGLLGTASSELANCSADWGTTYPGNSQLYDLTGNLREISKAGSNVFPVMGGSYLTEVEAGAGCDFDFLIGDGTYLKQDTGFRCCFGQDPSL